LIGRFVMALLVAVGVFFFASKYFSELEMRRAEARVSLYQSTLESALARFEHLPFVLSQDKLVQDGASGEGLDDLNTRLAAFADRSNLDAIYLMDRDGLTIAASNFDQVGSFLGQNYHFRPYFEDALKGKTGAFFGIGSTTGLPGYFISEPVRNQQEAIIGVIAIKLSLAPLVEAWTEGGETVFVSNSDGVVALSSEQEWLYRTLEPLAADQIHDIADRRQFAGQSLDALDWESDENGTATLAGERFVHSHLPAGQIGWTLHYLAERGRVIERATLSAILAGLVLMGLLTYAMALRSQRIQTALATSQVARRDLQNANKQLVDAQETLARTSKLAALGQLSASVTHELGQPIAALRNYIAAAEMESKPPELAQQATRIVSRMEHITKQLKFFATPGSKPQEKVDLRDVVRGALMLTQPDFDADGVTLKVDVPDQSVTVTGDRLRLEQVLINLLRNARFAALDGAESPEVSIKLWQEGSEAKLSVRDNGNGFEGDEEALFEPFRTNRPSGEGMGLGLSIAYSIMQDHEGTLRAVDEPSGGANFTFVLSLNYKET